MRTMTMKTATAKRKTAGLQLRSAVLCAVFALSLTNCHGLLDVRDPRQAGSCDNGPKPVFKWG